MKTTTSDEQLLERVRKSLSRIASARGLDGRLVVDIPVMYPSGATAVVEIERNRDRFWVSDMGHGLVEAEFVAAQDFYPPAARRIADEFGVQFDGNAIFALWVPEARLEAAMICVANASAQASAEAIRSASEAKDRRDSERIFERIQSVFGAPSVAKRMEISGRHAQWEAHNVVSFPDHRRAIFEPMSAHAGSVSSRFLMFSDLRAGDPAISLNAVVRDITALDEKAQMVGDVANIVGLDASDEDYRRFALAS